MSFLGVTINSVVTSLSVQVVATISPSATNDFVVVTDEDAPPAKWDVLINSDQSQQTCTIRVTSSERWVYLPEGSTNLTHGPTPTTWELVAEQPSSGSSSQDLYTIILPGTPFRWILTSTEPGTAVIVSPGAGGTVGLWLFA